MKPVLMKIRFGRAHTESRRVNRERQSINAAVVPQLMSS